MQTFAQRVLELEQVMQTNFPTINNAIIADLLQALREQQATLLDCNALLQSMCGTESNYEGAITGQSVEIAVVLERYALEPKV